MTRLTLLRRPLAAFVLTLLAPAAWSAGFTVNDAGDGSDANAGDGTCATAGGVCTLRAAIEETNALAGTDTVGFAIGSGPVTISPMSALPGISGPLTIDGYTQPGSSPNTLSVGNDAVINVRLDGAGAGAGATGLYFGLGSDGSAVRGMTISRFQSHGILVDAWGGSSSGYTIAGNFVGTDATGAALENSGAGVYLFDAVSNSTVGGAAPADRNVIAGNWSSEVMLSGTSSIEVRNNYLGTTPAGTTRLAHGSYGMVINSADHSTVADNVIGASTMGIYVYSLGADYTAITGNLIGVGSDGTANIAGSSHAIAVGSESSGEPRFTTIGGSSAGAGNTIANWGAAAVNINRASNALPYSTGNAILGNAIYNNTGLAIELSDMATGSGVGVTANDAGDGDTGPNDYQNFPEAATAVSDGSATTVSFTLNSKPSKSYRVELFASPSCHSSGYGEGRLFLGAQEFTTDGSGAVAGSVSSLPATTIGHVITMTATDLVTADTSEYSACVGVTAPPQITITASAIPAAAGTVNCTPNPANMGTTSSCTITGNAGYQLSGVSGSCGGTLSGNTFTTGTLSADCTVVAEFDTRLAVTTSGQGSVTSTPAGINCGATCEAYFGSAVSVSLTPTPAAGYGFTGWSGDCTGSGACMVAMEMPRNVNATFTLLPPATYTITTGANPAAGGSVSCTPNPVTAGATSSCTITTSAGYQLSGVSGSCGGTLSGATYSTAAINANCSVVAEFTTQPPVTYTISTSALPAAGGSVACSPNPVTAGGTSSCAITTSAGYQLTGVSGTCGGTLTGSTYTTAAINADCTVIAQFDAAAAVPMLAPWALWSLTGLLGGLGFTTLRRRQG